MTTGEAGSIPPEVREEAKCSIEELRYSLQRVFDSLPPTRPRLGQSLPCIDCICDLGSIGSVLYGILSVLSEYGPIHSPAYRS